MVENKDDWKKYELATTRILGEMSNLFGFECVEGKQTLLGLKSGTNWEIDAKGVLENGEAFAIIECRRYPTSKLSQEDVAAIAYRISDTGAASGIIVTPIGLQEGAQKVAASDNVLLVRLNADASPQQFVLEFLDKLFIRPLGQDMHIQGQRPGVVVSVKLSS